MNAIIKALLVEREGYRQRNLRERVEAVDEQLRGLGYEVFEVPETAAVEPAPEKARRAKGRRKRQEG